MGPSRARLAIAAIAIATAVAPGCQRDDKKKRGRRLVRVEKPPLPVRLLSESVVTRGAEPHQLLRYTPSTTPLRFTRAVTATVTETENPTKKPARTLPRVTQGFTLTRQGTGLLDVAVARPEVASGKPTEDTQYAREQLSRFESMLAGRRASVALDNRGQIGVIGGLSSDLARRELAAALVDSIVLLPDVPVGVGARWRIERAIPRARTFVKQTATYQIESIDGDKVVVSVDLLTVGERQPIALAGPTASTSELLALRVFQKGKLTIGLGSPTAIAGALERSDTIHVRTSQRQTTLRDYFAQSKSKVVLETR